MNLPQAFIGSMRGRLKPDAHPECATILFGFSFGYVLDNSGSIVPGKANEEIAEAILRLSNRYHISHIIAQEEVAQALRQKGLSLPDAHILPSFKSGQSGQTHSSQELWQQAVAKNLITSRDVVMPVAHAYHLPRVLLLGTMQKLNLCVPDVRNIRSFCHDSHQIWTTSARRWRAHELGAFWSLFRGQQ